MLSAYYIPTYHELVSGSFPKCREVHFLDWLGPRLDPTFFSFEKHVRRHSFYLIGTTCNIRFIRARRANLPFCGNVARQMGLLELQISYILLLGATSVHPSPDPS